MARSDFRTGLLRRLLRWAGSAGPDSAALHHLDRRMDLAGLAALVADVLPAALAAAGPRVADVLPAALVAADLPVAEEVAAADALREAERDADKRRQIVFRLEKLKSSA